MGNYVDQGDLENAITPRAVLEIYDDTKTRTINKTALDANIDRAESMVDSYLEPEQRVPLADAVLQPGSVQPVGVKKPVDRLVKNAALLFLIVYSYERHSEYAKVYGKTIEKNTTAAEALCLRIQQGTQRLPDTNPTAPPKNVGGFTFSDAHNMFIGECNGAPNSGDL